MNPGLFKHHIQFQVRSYEVDWQGIVHNAVYLQYFEVGRVEYLKHLGASLDLNTVRGSSKVVLVRNEVDYRAPALFDHTLTIRTRVAWIRNSSFAMEGIIEDAQSGSVIAENVAVHVWLDPATNRGTAVPDEFRKNVKAFEGENCVIDRTEKKA